MIIRVYYLILVTPCDIKDPGLALDQVMACHPTTPSHYLNQCWFIYNQTLRRSEIRIKIQWFSFNKMQLKSHFLRQCWFIIKGVLWHSLKCKCTMINIITLLFFLTVHFFSCTQGAVSIRKTVLPGMAIPMLKIRRRNGRLIFNMEITIRR